MNKYPDLDKIPIIDWSSEKIAYHVNMIKKYEEALRTLYSHYPDRDKHYLKHKVFELVYTNRWNLIIACNYLCSNPEEI